MAGRGPEWELVEVGSGSLLERLLDNVYDEDNEDQFSFGAAEDEPVPHVVIHSTSSPYEGKQTSRKVYPSQQKANEKIMKQWNEYKDGYDLEECKLFRNDYGCLRFYMRGCNGAVDIYHSEIGDHRPPWELLEVGESQGGGAALNGDRAEIEEIVSERESKNSANDEDDEDDDFSDY
ncbi:hypothetical protein HK098_007159 [Nowakowskiella sp. JEL0407]|nr:hypothetical protein HK098_007159 [Nowakowskiella sp. JEL0407]